MERARLTPDQAAAVFRRAAELEAQGASPPDETLDLLALEEIGREVGLSPQAIRRAVAELQAAPPASAVPAPAARPGLLGTPVVVVERTVPGAPAEVGSRVDEWLWHQGLEKRRQRPGRSEWVPRRGLVAGLRRNLDVGRRLKLNDVCRLGLGVVDAADGRSRVRIEADLGEYRRNLKAGLVVAPLATGGALAAVGLVGLGYAGGPDVEVILAALPAGAGLAAGGGGVARAVLRRRRASVVEALEGLCDQLEYPRWEQPGWVRPAGARRLQATVDDAWRRWGPPPGGWPRR